MSKTDKKDKNMDLEELAKALEFVKSEDFKKIIGDFVSSGYSKDAAKLQNLFANKVFDWNNDETKKPARNAFLKLTRGYDQLSKTFNPEQKEIAEQTDFRENMTRLVLSMREQIEHFKEDAKVQSKRFYVSTAIAVASIAVSIVIAVIAIIIR
jgi:dimeric dUTPase (all-alpha-NTP-PPase superfamily)